MICPYSKVTKYQIRGFPSNKTDATEVIEEFGNCHYGRCSAYSDGKCLRVGDAQKSSGAEKAGQYCFQATESLKQSKWVGPSYQQSCMLCNYTHTGFKASLNYCPNCGAKMENGSRR